MFRPRPPGFPESFGILWRPQSSQRFRETLGDSGGFREAPGGPGRLREAPGSSGKPREAPGELWEAAGDLWEAPGRHGRFWGFSGKPWEAPGSSGKVLGSPRPGQRVKIGKTIAREILGSSGKLWAPPARGSGQKRVKRLSRLRGRLWEALGSSGRPRPGAAGRPGKTAKPVTREALGKLWAAPARGSG